MTTIFRDEDVITFSTRNLSRPKSNGGMILEPTIGNEKEFSTLSSFNSKLLHLDLLFREILLSGFIKVSLK